MRAGACVAVRHGLLFEFGRPCFGLPLPACLVDRITLTGTFRAALFDTEIPEAFLGLAEALGQRNPARADEITAAAFDAVRQPQSAQSF